MLHERTSSLESEVAGLSSRLETVESSLRGHIDERVDSARNEVEALRSDVTALRAEFTHTDASALPVIGLGLLMTNLAPDAAGKPLLPWAAVMALATLFSLYRCGSVYLRWRARNVGVGQTPAP